ncbi:MAG: hypothetical protein ACLPKI_33075, partial [Streptosporangiaceae bacterium]
RTGASIVRLAPFDGRLSLLLVFSGKLVSVAQHYLPSCRAVFLRRGDGPAGQLTAVIAVVRTIGIAPAVLRSDRA